MRRVRIGRSGRLGQRCAYAILAWRHPRVRAPGALQADSPGSARSAVPASTPCACQCQCQRLGRRRAGHLHNFHRSAGRRRLYTPVHAHTRLVNFVNSTAGPVDDARAKGCQWAMTEGSTPVDHVARSRGAHVASTRGGAHSRHRAATLAHRPLRGRTPYASPSPSTNTTRPSPTLPSCDPTTMSRFRPGGGPARCAGRYITDSGTPSAVAHAAHATSRACAIYTPRSRCS